jgi:hypothetical protein
MSLAWCRIVPSGKAGGQVNKKGVVFYRDILKELKANGITPFVTIFHWDLPQSLAEEYGGFLSREIITDFEVCIGRRLTRRRSEQRVEKRTKRKREGSSRFSTDPLALVSLFRAAVLLSSVFRELRRPGRELVHHQQVLFSFTFAVSSLTPFPLLPFACPSSRPFLFFSSPPPLTPSAKSFSSYQTLRSSRRRAQHPRHARL